MINMLTHFGQLFQADLRSGMYKQALSMDKNPKMQLSNGINIMHTFQKGIFLLTKALPA